MDSIQKSISSRSPGEEVAFPYSFGQEPSRTVRQICNTVVRSNPDLPVLVASFQPAGGQKQSLSKCTPHYYLQKFPETQTLPWNFHEIERKASFGVWTYRASLWLSHHMTTGD